MPISAIFTDFKCVSITIVNSVEFIFAEMITTAITCVPVAAFIAIQALICHTAAAYAESPCPDLELLVIVFMVCTNADFGAEIFIRPVFISAETTAAVQPDSVVAVVLERPPEIRLFLQC